MAEIGQIPNGNGHKSPEKRGRGRPRDLQSEFEARRRKEWALARLREIEVEKRTGELLPAVEVQEAWADILRQVRSGALALPSRVRARLPHLTAHDVEVIADEVRQVLTAIANGEPPDGQG